MFMRTRTANQVFLPLLAALFISGCATYPTVRYLAPSDPEAAGAIKYNLQGSMVTLGKKQSKASGNSAVKAGAGKNNGGADDQKAAAVIRYDPIRVSSNDELIKAGAEALVTATESKRRLYAIKPTESFLTKTSVSVSFVDNTRMIESIGTAFEDNRIEVIKAVGGILVTAAKMRGKESATEGEQLGLPVVIDLSEMDDADPQPWKQIRGYTKWWYKAELLKPDAGQDDRMKTVDFEKELGRDVRYLAYSSCQDIRLKVTFSAAAPIGDVAGAAEFDLRIANPNYLSTLNFPLKGSIAMHSVCGADLKTEDGKTISNLAVLEALVSEVEALYKAQKAAKK
jgi:hypothetical protein